MQPVTTGDERPRLPGREEAGGCAAERRVVEEARGSVDEQQRVVEVVPEVETCAGDEAQRVESELRPALRRDEQAPLDPSVDERAHPVRSRDPRHLREHRNSERSKEALSCHSSASSCSTSA